MLNGVNKTNGTNGSTESTESTYQVSEECLARFAPGKRALSAVRRLAAAVPYVQHEVFDRFAHL